jgi:molybdopterin/thiamine biosynthesis adenylyltransferase
MQVKVVGMGGIGTHLIVPLCRYLDSLGGEHTVTLFDGDSFEPQNSQRQDFVFMGKKVEVVAEKIRQLGFSNLAIEVRPWYITSENVFLCLRVGDYVFSGVDNHATRRLLSEHCKTLDDVVLISGGNDFTDGNVQIYIREEGKDITPPLTHLHPEIADPADRNPAEMSCEELAQSGSPQLIFTNFMVVAWMLSTFWLLSQKGAEEMDYSEIYFDLSTGMSRSVKRELCQETPRKE